MVTNLVTSHALVSATAVASLATSEMTASSKMQSAIIAAKKGTSAQPA